MNLYHFHKYWRYISIDNIYGILIIKNFFLMVLKVQLVKSYLPVDFQVTICVIFMHNEYA